jgi:hypothetical protein
MFLAWWCTTKTRQNHDSGSNIDTPSRYGPLHGADQRLQPLYALFIEQLGRADFGMISIGNESAL